MFNTLKIPVNVLRLVCAGVIALGLILMPGTITGQGEPALASSVKADFPASITFNLDAAASANITDIRLQYRIEHDAFARVVSEAKPVFTPASHVTTSWTWDMRQSGGLPPGAAVEYWWVVKDAAGNSDTSSPAVFTFSDARFKWKQVSQGNLVMNWYGGSEASARSYLSDILQGLAGLEARTGASLTRPVNIFVYADTHDMMGAMIFPQEWTGAATYTDFGTFIIGLSDDEVWNTSTMVHELAHLITYQLSYGPYSVLPEWLTEGMSMYAEGDLDIYLSSTLISALNNNATLTVRSLSSPFSATSELSYLAYAESFSFVDYLVATYGQQKLLMLLDVFKNGAGYDQALGTIYGIDMDELYSGWFKYALRKYVGVPA